MPGARNLPPLCRICYHYFYESETTDSLCEENIITNRHPICSLINFTDRKNVSTNNK